MKTFIENQFNTKRAFLAKRLATAGAINSPLCIPFVKHFEYERENILKIYINKVSFEIEKINKNLTIIKRKSYKSFIVNLVKFIAGFIALIYMVIQLVENQTVKSLFGRFFR